MLVCLDTKNSEEMKQQNWISVKDRLPTTCGDYLVTDGESQMVAHSNLSGVWDFFDNHEWWQDEQVTHWMPLPKLPEQ